MLLDRNKHRINIFSALILVTLTLSAGISVYIVMQKQSEALLSKNIVSLLQSHQRLFQSEIEQSLTKTRTASSRPFVIKNLRILVLNPKNTTALADLQRIANSFLPYGFTGLSFYDVRGQEVAHSGHFSSKYELRVPLKSNHHAYLLWDGQFTLQASSDIFDQQGRNIGRVKTEASLSSNTEAFTDIASFGKTSEFAVCAPLVNDVISMDCFLNRRSGKEFKRLARVVENKPLPMNYALNGENGIIFAKDYRREQVVAAYAPVGAFGLGMVIKIDQAELYYPVLTQLTYIVPLLALLVMVGMLLLNFLVRPLVRKLVESEWTAKVAYADLRDAQEKLSSVFEGSNDAIMLLSAHGFIDCNARTLELFGLKDKTEFIGHHPSEFSPPLQPDRRDSTALATEYFEKAMRSGKYQFEWVHQRKNGDEFSAEVLLSAFNYGSERILQATVRDITLRKEAEVALRESENVFRRLFDNATDPNLLIKNGCFIECNTATMKLLGFNHKSEFLNHSPARISPQYQPDGRPSYVKIAEMIAIALREGGHRFEWVHSRADDSIITVEVTLTPITVAGEVILHTLWRDISERKAAQERIEFLAYHDTLTGLPNRLLAKDHLEQAILAAERENTGVGLMFVDLDKFKTINDSLGHVIGDSLLKAVSIRLRECLRETDTLSRQGGDEFLIVLGNMRDTDAITLVADKILERLASTFEIDHVELAISLSIGIAVFPEDGRDFDTLLKKSDTAMYQAKDSGRNTYRFHTEQMNADAVEHLRIRNGLRHALEHGEFVLHYQPQISLATGAVFGAEALIRWHHPELGMVPPGRFISIAEDSGLIVPMGDWVLQEACRQLVAWRKAGLPELIVAVNLSAVQFKRGNVETSVVRALEQSGLNAALLELELTESILIKDTEKVLDTVHRLKLLGVKFSIDDFGTGYSSLSYLKRFNVDKLKIDQSFVRDMADDPNDAAIVSAIIHMAKSLNLTTIAEGVEDERQLALLRQLHCDEVQGYYFARPMPADEFMSFVAGTIKPTAK